MEIISREEWGARPPKYRIPIPTPTPELWLHHSASASGFAARIRAIQNFHMDERGWPDIAYTFLINHAGYIYEGVPIGYRGTHTAGHNTSGSAICLLGNFNNVEPTDAAMYSLVELAVHGYREGWWSEGFTGGHRDTRGADPGDCPGDNLYARLAEINQLIKEGGVMSPEDKAEILAAIKSNGVLSEPGGSANGNVWQLLLRTRADTLLIRQKLDAGLDLTDEDVDAIVAGINASVSEETALIIGQKLIAQ